MMDAADRLVQMSPEGHIREAARSRAAAWQAFNQGLPVKASLHMADAQVSAQLALVAAQKVSRP